MENFTKLAQAQLIGYSLAKDGATIIDLVEGMGLREWEWEQIKEETNDLSDSEIEKIDEYFNV